MGSAKFSVTAAIQGRDTLSFNLLEMRWKCQVLLKSHAEESGRKTNKAGMTSHILQ